jgi:hypothetical protein
MQEQSKNTWRLRTAAAPGLLPHVASLMMFLTLSEVRFAMADQACFDLSHKVQTGLALPQPLGHDGGTLSASGKKTDDLFWAAVQGDTSRTIPDLLHDLMTHETTKGGRISEMKISLVPDSNFLVRQVVRFRVNPFPFVTVEWTEDWAVSLLAGDAKKPEKVLITYEKVSGTSHIRHLCGQFELAREADGKTRIQIYEEAAATGRSQQDTLSGIATSLRKLQNIKP